MQTYRHMKKSGVAWLGDMPNDWKLVRGKFLYQNKKVTNKGLVEPQRLALTLKGVIERYDGDGVGLNPESLESYQIFERDDLVFKLIDLENKKTSRVGLVNKRGIMSPAYIRATPIKKVFAKYFYYYYYSLYLTYVFNNIAGEGVRANLSPKELLELPVTVPDFPMQEKIANFLDQEIEKIEDLIAKQERILKLLEEKRRVTITNAVTRGLRENITYAKPTNAWFPEIPSHWNTSKLKYFTELITDGTHTTPNYVADGIPFISIKDISSGKINFSDTKFISEEEHQVLSRHARVEKGDILFTRIGTLGVNVVVDTDKTFDIFVSLGLIKLIPGAISNKYLVYCMSSNYYLEYIQQVKAGGGTAAAKFNLGDVANSPIIVPPQSEQEEIVLFLNDYLIMHQKMVKQVLLQINLLKERRVSLISGIVTGKVKV